MLVTVIVLCLTFVSSSHQASYNYTLPYNVSRNVVRRIFPHSPDEAIDSLVSNITATRNTEERKRIIENYVNNATAFGKKLSRTVSPFDSKEFAMMKMFHLMDQREALLRFFDAANAVIKQTIAMGLANELYELFYKLDERYDHLFPAASVAWVESITITLSYTNLVNPKDLIEGEGLMKTDPKSAFLLYYWQLYDTNIETNVLFV